MVPLLAVQDPIGRSLDRPLDGFFVLELLNTIYIVYERSIGDIFFKILLFEEGKMPATVVHVTCHSLRQALSLPKRR